MSNTTVPPRVSGLDPRIQDAVAKISAWAQRELQLRPIDTSGSLDAISRLAGVADKFPVFKAPGKAQLQSISTATITRQVSPGVGNGVNSIYRSTSAKSTWPYTSTVSNVSGATLTIGSAVAQSAFAPTYMKGVVYARIWNTTKNQSAWVSDAPSTTTFTVTNAADISGWTAGDALLLADDHGATGKMLALDISPMMQAQLGRVFAQKGVVASVAMLPQTAGNTTGMGIWASPISGGQQSVGGVVTNGAIISPCLDLSPISASNLVYVNDPTPTPTSVTLVNVIFLLEDVTVYTP